MIKACLLSVLLLYAVACSATGVFSNETFASQDSILVVDANNRVLFEWQVDKPLIPASLMKLATSHLAINKWGLNHRFITDFYLDKSVLWVKGYGDPFIVSEELDLIAEDLQKLGVSEVTEIRIDNSYFKITSMPGRTKVADPYNAPLSAVSANFNTAMLQTVHKKLISAEPQTPLTNTAKRVAHTVGKKVERVNLINDDNAQRNFAELLQLKAGWSNVEIHINQQLPDHAELFYRHKNSRTLADVLRGTMEFSNNFIANHVFLKLADGNGKGSVDLKQASRFANRELAREFEWQGFVVNEGSGLSRVNRLSARQLNDLLGELRPHKSLFKEYPVNTPGAVVHAKTGTLSDVRSYAGYIEFPDRHYRFVFNFNRRVPYRYREQLLERLLADLAKH